MPLVPKSDSLNHKPHKINKLHTKTKTKHKPSRVEQLTHL